MAGVTFHFFIESAAFRRKWNRPRGRTETAGVQTVTPEPVRLQNVQLRYGDGPAVLRDVSFTLSAGSFHFLTGESGAGKTSLLGLMYLALRPAQGRLFLFGEDAASLPRRRAPELRRKIGVVFQDFRLLDHLSTFDNVALPLRLQGRPEEEVRRHVTELLEWVGLADRMQARPPLLSGGQQQRIAIARAVITRPSLLLADEPTGNVDDAIARRLLYLFGELNRMGATVVIATHNPRLLSEFDRPVLHLDSVGHHFVGPALRVASPSTH